MRFLDGERIRLALAGFVALLMAAGQLASPCRAAEDTWTYKADMPTVRAFFGGGVADGKIYAIGGAPSNSSVTSAVEMYDPTTDTWTRMANMPSGRCSHATCTFDGKIYVFGGCRPTVYSTAKKNVYVYDPQIDTWTQKADMPYANAYCGIAVIDGTVYLIGGMLSPFSPPVPTVMAYDPMTESWTQKADMPTARGGLSACVVDGRIYAIGGCTENWSVFSYKHIEVYDPSMDTWARKSDMPTERWGLGTCVVGGKIYAIGGWSGSDACTTTEVYDPITDTWTTKSPTQEKRNGAFICSVGDKIYAMGGAYAVPQPGFLSSVEQYDTGADVPSPTEANKAISRRDFEEAMNQGKLEVYDEIVDPGVVLHTTSGDFTGIEGFKAVASMYLIAFPDFHVTIEDMVAEGDLVCIRFTNTGTHQGELMGIPATGASIVGTGMAIHRIADGRIQEAWLSADMLGIMQQLGVITPARPTPEDYTWGVLSDVTGDPGDPETNKAIFELMIDEVFKGNLAVIDEVFAADYVKHDPASPIEVRGPEGFKQWLGTMSEPYFSQSDITTEDMIGEGDEVAVRWTWSGTHTGEFMGIPPTGRQIAVTGTCIHRFADGKFVESWSSYDVLGMIQQLTGPYCTEPIPGDVNDDCKVDFADLAIMVSHWLQCNLDPPETCWE